MEQWQKTALLLCLFGVFKEFRPSEPYVTKYLKGPQMNFTSNEITHVIYPTGTYSTLVLLIFVFLFTDILRYKPVLIMTGLSGITIYIMLIVARSLEAMQVMEVFYGFFSASEVAYYTYIYAKVEKCHYQIVSSYTRVAYLVGRAISGVSSQILISSNMFSYYDLNFFTLGGMIVTTVWAIVLPSVNKSSYFHRRNYPLSSEVNEVINRKDLVEEPSVLKKVKMGMLFLKKDFVDAYSQPYVLKWCFWWALSTCAYYQVLNYVQVLWEEITDESGRKYESNYNGAVEATYTILSALMSLACGKINIRWDIWGERCLALLCFLIGIILYVASTASVIWPAYMADVLTKMLYHGIVTIANSEVAKHISEDSFALVFGVNTFIALGIQSLLTYVLINQLGLNARMQFKVYAVYFFIIGFIFSLISLLTLCRNRSKKHVQSPNTDNKCV